MQSLAAVPPSFAKIEVDVDRLQQLPIGIKISDRSGQATVTAQRVNDSTLVVTATCDSLAREVTILTQVLERYRSNEAVVEKPPDVVVKREPSGWQWFWIRVGQLAIIALAVGYGYKAIKKYLIKI